MATAVTENGVVSEKVVNNDENVAPESATVALNSDDEITVFHDPDNFNVKHPLMNEWSLWFTKPTSGKGDNWNDLLKEIVSFNSVEEFWGIYNNIMPTSQLPPKTDYHLFKKGVKPEWEDVQNKYGGKWSYAYRFSGKDKHQVPIDELWLHAQLAAIGETLENEDDNEVMGVVVNVRKAFYRIGLWTRSAGRAIPNDRNGNARSAEESQKILKGLGRRFKDSLRLKDNEILEFSGHSESANAGSTRAKAKFTI